jgi:hypothetical protein
LFGHARPFSHPTGLAARQLYDEGSKIPANCALAGTVALLHQMLARNHLGYDQTGAKLMGNSPERQVCNARHGRQKRIAPQCVAS